MNKRKRDIQSEYDKAIKVAVKTGKVPRLKSSHSEFFGKKVNGSAFDFPC